jgi:hypothetical protein
MRRDAVRDVKDFLSVNVRLGWIINLMKGTEGRCEKRRKEITTRQRGKKGSK